MCFDGVARVSRAAAQLAFFTADVLDLYEGKTIWNVFIDSLFLNALPVPMLATGFSRRSSLDVFHVFRAAKASKLDLKLELCWSSS